ncbi:MAG TPA: metalloregulator ArsR/SmtB family transcription factor [Stellaceae bacterium]|nr:metalloregulator ArsR/SmtB family transcription factor [Stellaceae bacterium]
MSDTRDREASRTGRAAVLEHVKREGPVTAGALARALGVTTMAVRQHLDGLCREGLVAHETRGGGRGRPSKLWRTTAAADRHFPDSHAALAADLIAQIRTVFGEEGLDRLVALRTAEQERLYSARLGAQRTLKARLEALARVRSEEGYMAEVRREAAAGAWLLVENHCPICTAARLCAGLCREELALFQRLLGNGVRVERISHIQAGAGRCAYRVSPLS